VHRVRCTGVPIALPKAVINCVLAPPTRPLGIDANHQVIVVAHYRISGHIHGKHSGELLDALYDPAAAVFITRPGGSVLPTQKSAANTAVDDVIPRGIGQGYEGSKRMPFLSRFF